MRLHGEKGSPLVLAHRGGDGPWAENSVDAFRGARRSGADGVELDVRRCADGTLAVLHDPVIPGLGAVHELVGRDLPSSVPTLSHALENCSGLVVDVEIKNLPWDPGYDPAHRVAEQVVEELSARSGDAGDAGHAGHVVSCFWSETLCAVSRATRSANLDVALGLLALPRRGGAGGDPRAAADLASGLGFDLIEPFHEDVTAEVMSHARDLGLAVWAWTVNEPAAAQELRRLGVGAIISDHPARMLDALGRAASG